MNVKFMLSKLFLGGSWMVGYRDKLVSNDKQYKIVTTPLGQWIADPFIYEYNGHHYLFVEQYVEKRNRAGIGYYEFINGEPVSKGIIIDKPYHMSYPCVFNYKETHYMIPESSANSTIEMYRAVEFPDKWELDSVLLKDVKYVDSTVYQNEHGCWLFSYRKNKSGWELTIFELDMENKTLIKKGVKEFRENTGRPAGFLFKDGKGNLCRPSQDCRNKYGKALLINTVQMSGMEYKEDVSSVIQSSDIEMDVNADRIHTINQDSRFEVIDVYKESIDLFHAYKIFKRAYLKKYFFN